MSEMADLLAQASAIAESRDLDHLEAFIAELTRWRPTHDGDCRHCDEELGALSARLLVEHHVDAVWLLGQTWLRPRH